MGVILRELEDREIWGEEPETDRERVELVGWTETERRES